MYVCMYVCTYIILLQDLFCSIQHVTKQMYGMALALSNEFLLNKLAVGDVACNELFYHNNCLKKLETDYKRLLKTELSSMNDDWIKTFAVNKVIQNGKHQEQYF